MGQSIVPNRVGAVRRFREEDCGTGVHSWKNSGGDSLINTRGWAALHVVVQKYVDGQISPKDLYDQILIVENPGAVVVCTSGDRVGLVQNFRFTGTRLFSDSAYVKKLADEGRWDELLATLGAYQWELPRGMAPQCEGDDPSKYILAAAKVEAAEEGGFSLRNPRIAAMLNPNSTFFAHPQYVLAAEFVSQQESTPEAQEMIGKSRLFSRQEIDSMILSGEMSDGLTLAALRIVGF